jgi:hypothetical protein
MTETPPGTVCRTLRLSPDDNVLILLSPVETGEIVIVEGARMRMASALPLGHKIAARGIAAGEKILKYGVPIGSATCAIAPGEHVHTHNLRSDYLPGPLEH